MEDLKLLVTHACKRSDEVAFACSRKDEWQTSKGEPACSCSDRRRVAPMMAIVTRPIVGLRSQCHTEEVDGSDCTKSEDTHGSCSPVQSTDTKRSVADEAYGSSPQPEHFRRSD